MPIDSASPDESPDLDAYFARIGWTGGTAPTLATLDGLVERHVRTIPFENLDVLLGRGIRLDLPGVQAKLVGARRGGYCFEHCTLMQAVLRRLGYDVLAHTARVSLVHGRAAAPRTHMFLVVTLPEGRFVVDPGFGSLAPRQAVPLADAGAEGDGRALAWLQREDPYWVLRLRRAGEAMEGWFTTLDADQPIDFVLGNHYTSTHPESGFRRRLTLRAYTPEGRVTLLNRQLTRWTGDRPGEPEQLADRAALRALVRETFGADLPELEALRVPDVPEWD